MKLHNENKAETSQNDCAAWPYLPLEPFHKDIRYIVLRPGNDDDLITCELHHGNLHSAAPQYEALSYCWGNLDDTINITLRFPTSKDGAASFPPKTETSTSYIGFQVPVTRNLYQALRVLRHRTSPRNLWVDALCIDQCNIFERNSQVRLMHEVYSCAWAVLIYLGDLKVDFQTCHWYIPDLLWLFNSPWFTRVWVIQEVAVAGKAQFITDQGFFPLDEDFLRLVRNKSERHGLSIPAPLQYALGTKQPNIDVLDMLHAARACLSTDPRDKLFALLGIASGSMHHTITIDYSEDYSTAFTLAAVVMILDRGDLSIISYAHSSPTHDSSNQIPSWVPDWTYPSRYRITPPQFDEENFGPWRLKVKVQNLDDTAISSSGACDTGVIVAKPVVTASILVVCAHFIGAVHYFPPDSNTWQAAPRMHTRLRKFLAGEELSEPIMPQDSGCLGTRRVRDPYHESNLEINRELHRASTAFHRSLDRGTLENIEQYMNDNGSGSYMFQLRHGLIGLARHGFQPGDVVFAIDGFHTPVILRSFHGQEYRIVSECRLFGLTPKDLEHPPPTIERMSSGTDREGNGIMITIH
jgi:hypothetical protein